jgi:hypothetical protein
MRKWIPTILALVFAAVVLAPELVHAQTAYSGTGPFTFVSNSTGEYWCFVSGDVEFRAAGTGAVSWVTVCPTAVAAVAAPVAVAAPITYAAQPVYTQPTPPVIVINADPCATNNAYGYASVNPFGYGLGNPYGAGFAYGYNNGCGQSNAGFGCLAFGCRSFPRACNFPGSCQQGLPPTHHHDCVPTATHTCP